MKISSRLRLFAWIVIALMAAPATAHAHWIGGSGLMSGLTHPFLGTDHLLAIIAVGIVSTLWKGKIIWKIPGTFVALMVVGGLMGMDGVRLPFAETGIALSILLLGTMLAIQKQIPLEIMLMSVALFGMMHGYAHGSELPGAASPLRFGMGFVMATSVLHLAGALIGRMARERQWTIAMMRAAGTGMAVMGGLFLMA